MKMEFKEKHTMDEDEMMDMASDKHHHSKTMTMEDVAEQLQADFIDEIEDSKKYFHMSKIAYKAHCEEDCHYLTEMAKDEYTHAYFIHEFMKEHDMHISEEHEEAFEKLSERMKEFF